MATAFLKLAARLGGSTIRPRPVTAPSTYMTSARAESRYNPQAYYPSDRANNTRARFLTRSKTDGSSAKRSRIPRIATNC